MSSLWSIGRKGLEIFWECHIMQHGGASRGARRQQGMSHGCMNAIREEMGVRDVSNSTTTMMRNVDKIK